MLVELPWVKCNKKDTERIDQTKINKCKELKDLIANSTTEYLNVDAPDMLTGRPKMTGILSGNYREP